MLANFVEMGLGLKLKIPKLTLWFNTLHRNDEPRHLLQNAKAFITELKGALPMTSRVSCTEFGQRK
jgi:hypothetical protein